MTRVLLVPDLPIERWPSMDRYASRLAGHLPEHAGNLEFSVAGPIASLTVDLPRPTGAGPDRVLVANSDQPTAGINFGRYFQRYVSYPRSVRRLPADVVHVLDHSYAHLLPHSLGTTTVVTVHDLQPLQHLASRAPGLQAKIRDYFLKRVVRGLRRANTWIVATHWLEGELATWLGGEPRIHVIPYGVDDAFFDQTPQPAADIRRVWGLAANDFVILHVGSVGPRKNLPALLDTLAALRAAGIPAHLVQVGATFSSEQLADLRARQLESVVRRMGDTPEADLRAAYRAADVLLFPSHYEGFGLPVLEAMASGLPAVTSGVGGLTELAGDAAMVVGSGAVADYVRALRRLIDDPAWRAGRSARGLARAREFRWSETARRTAAVYRDLAHR